jgi:hypothetical protein
MTHEFWVIVFLLTNLSLQTMCVCVGAHARVFFPLVNHKYLACFYILEDNLLQNLLFLKN